MTCLFIGGTKDGQWVGIPDDLKRVTYGNETYEAVRLAIKDGQIVRVFVPEKSPDGYAMAMLLSGYRKPNP